MTSSSLLWASEAVAGPSGQAERPLTPPQLGSPQASPLRRRRYAPLPGGAPSANSRPIQMSLGAYRDGQHMAQWGAPSLGWPPAGGSDYGYGLAGSVLGA